MEKSDIPEADTCIESGICTDNCGDERRFMHRLAILSLFSALIMSAGIAAGAYIAFFEKDAAQMIIDMISAELVSKVISADPFVQFIQIFINNLSASLIIFAGGVILGLVTGYILFSNGFIIGVVAGCALETSGAAVTAASLFPHGIIEIPALLIAAGLGLLLAGDVWSETVRKKGDAAENAKRYGALFVKIVIPMLIAAAFIESYITPAVIDAVA